LQIAATLEIMCFKLREYITASVSCFKMIDETSKSKKSSDIILATEISRWI